MTPVRKKSPPVDPLATLKVEVSAGLGESYIKCECLFPQAADVLARMHRELERLVALHPAAGVTVDVLPAGTIWMAEEGDPEQGKRFGFK